MLRKIKGEYTITAAELLREAYGEIHPDIGRYLFFAENGCGDYYGYRLSETGTAEPGILLWEHETCKTAPVTESPEELITRYYRDEL